MFLKALATSIIFLARIKSKHILDLQSIPRESNNKDVAAMLVELTIEANEESFVIVHQHGGNDVTCKSRIIISCVVDLVSDNNMIRRY